MLRRDTFERETVEIILLLALLGKIPRQVTISMQRAGLIPANEVMICRSHHNLITEVFPQKARHTHESRVLKRLQGAGDRRIADPRITCQDTSSDLISIEMLLCLFEDA